jgi:hypothetical protein
MKMLRHVFATFDYEAGLAVAQLPARPPVRIIACMVEKRLPGRVPRGWPPSVSTPGTEDWQETAAAWLLDLLPELRQYPTVQGHPVVMAFIGRHMLTGAVEGARQGFRTTRSELGAVVPPEVTDAVLSELLAEGQRLSNALRAVELVESALRDG